MRRRNFVTVNGGGSECLCGPQGGFETRPSLYPILFQGVSSGLPSLFRNGIVEWVTIGNSALCWEVCMKGCSV